MAKTNLNATALVPVETPALKVINGHGMATSQEVADRFGKRHDNVLRAIRSIECDDDYRRLNFEETIVTVPGPKGSVRQETMYLMTRDGFALLVMGFTGPQAMAWKISFLKAFKQLEQAHIELLEKTATQAIADQEFRQTLSWAQRLDAFDDMHRARAELDREADPAQRLIKWKKLAFVCRALGDAPDPLESMTPPLLLNHSKRQQDDSDKIADLTDMRNHLLTTLIALYTAAEPLLFPVHMEEMPEAVRAARKAISMGLAQKGGAA